MTSLDVGTFSVASVDQPVLCARRLGESAAAEKVLVDPNKEAGVVALDWWFPSQDGQMLAYGLSENGDEESVLHVLNVQTGELLGERIPRTRYTRVAWKDNQSFFYTRYPMPGDVPAGEENYHGRVFFHELGSDYTQDPLIFGEGLPMKATPGVRISDDGRYIFAVVHEGWTRSDVFVAKMGEELDFVPVFTGQNAHFWGQTVGDTLYAHTNYQAPNYQIVRVNLTQCFEKRECQMAEWDVVIPESRNKIEWFTLIGNDKLCLHYLEDASSKLMVFGTDGQLIKDVELPRIGTLEGMTEAGIDGKPFVVFESFFVPPTIYQLDMQTLSLEYWEGAATSLDPEQYVIEKHFYESKDGTRIPMFIMHKRGLAIDGQVPTILHGYGGFDISKTPVYTPGIFPWLSQGGIFAIACLRGGGEYGASWHHDGRREKKQNVYDDFIYAGKYLLAQGYTDTEHLGIYGRSNGGLLVGATMTQAPELFKAVVCQVPLLDMYRFHKFLIGGLWTSEYGNPDVAEEFAYIYSPYHHVVEGVKYPATLFYTAFSDTRVHPLHAVKMTAAVQAVSDAPTLLFVESAAGHGVGKPTTKFAEEQADLWSFMAWQLGLQVQQ